ncbi:LuxR C-terminal-related transcriptional regulator [Kitasatospora sp. NPDC057542]|uniref:LuxR C-terminal-related transcriptional regulator n=1 Tax=Streptomycetaceae TaxID=2062 RepID=UPI001CCACE42|nr:LuxR C-terminal-related transcriptional regulator [Streptomyces sp. LS1784]
MPLHERALKHQIPVLEEPRVRPCGHYPDLTPKEGEVMALLAADLSAVQIAEHTRASDYAVRTRLSTLGLKLGAATSPQITDVACRTGLLVPPRGVLKTPISVTAVTSFQALAEGGTRSWIATRKKVSENTVANHLAVVRARMRTSWNAAAVYRLHGVAPPVLNATVPPCPFCVAGGAS